MTPFITLDANMERAIADREAYAAFINKPLAERAAVRKEMASDTPAGFGDADFTRLSLAEGKFIDLAIHKDTFLDDAAIRSTVTADTPVAWKTRYSPVVGVFTGSVYGTAPRMLYQTQDSSEFLQPFVVAAQEVTVPKMALTQDPAKLGQRTAMLERQAEQLRLKMETFLVNVMTGQILGTDLATSIYNYATLTVNPYNGKTVYVVDPGVQTGTYDTTNIIDASSEGGITPSVLYQLITQAMLSDRTIRTIHIPKRGFPWRELVKEATVVANASAFSNTARTNPGLNSVPMAEWEKMWKTNMATALEGGLIVEMFGVTFKLKANNVLPQGVAIVTTDEPAAEVFDVADRSWSYDVEIPRERFFETHGEQRQLMIASPSPWQRNWFCLKFDTPAL